MCKARFHAVTRLRDDLVKRFRGNKRRRPTGEEDPSVIADRLETEDEEEEVEGARAVCLHCGDGGSEEQLILCDGTGCENVRDCLFSIFSTRCGFDCAVYGAEEFSIQNISSR